MEPIYPWQRDQWQFLHKLIANNSVPHALLITGPTGVGKSLFANQLCASVLCNQTSLLNSSCGECKYCQLFKAGTYPDFTRIVPEEVNDAITVDEIRDLIEQINLTRHYDNYKIALIESAGNMNNNAANALLKTLEEPPPSTLIILVSDKSQTLPATVRSRCHTLVINIPSKEDALTWLNSQAKDVDWLPLLAIAQGAPLQALTLHTTELLQQRSTVIQGVLGLIEKKSNPLEVATQMETVSVPQGIEWIQGLILDLVRLKAAEDPITLENPDFYRSLLALAPRLEVPLLLDFWDWLLDRKRKFDNSLNRRLVVEELFLKSQQLLGNVP